ncbi:SMEK domain-containing protein [Leptolyngbya sp. FACHB-261]|uniref:SMEK domain-containing protein n=1 Tax=Leptolyngbya sp. FACHB-261 TaxID=2692806 RepID=UPI0016871AAE|nr:SMEK domain-containing protein [Leptolyngbya sp. FACHB-261]MBD2099767.1 SMEK domain-containing protein [Leptolyngbya sp. FACHB-261]
MQSLHTQNKINELMAVFVSQVKGATSMGRTDINKVAETVLIPLFKEIYGYTKLKNLNTDERANYPAIDLGDEIARVAIQVTSTTDSEKIKDTLRGFVEHKLYEKFDRLFVYILTEKQKTYSGRGYQNIIQNKFLFDKNKDVRDYRDLLAVASNFQIDKLRRILNILEANFGNTGTPLLIEPEPPAFETVHLNLLELFFPKNLYISDISIDRERVIDGSVNEGLGLNRDASTRDVVRAALGQAGVSFGLDWVCHKGRIVTFHDLRNSDLPLSTIIDRRTTTSIDPQEFYEIDDDHENIFKSLLGRCLQQKLYHQHVVWQHQDKVFIFSEVEGSTTRKEEWYSDKKNTRTVYERVMKNNKPDEIFYCKHFAFRTKYQRFGQNWYLCIVPDWFFSFDGYRRSFYAKEKLDWLKRHENDRSIYNHLSFIAAFLKTERPLDLFFTRRHYSFLSFGELVTFDDSPSLNDDDWNPKTLGDANVSTDELKQIELPLEL